MTYEKPKVAVQGMTLLGDAFEGGVDVYEALKAHKTVKTIVTDGQEQADMLIPFHAIKVYGVFISTENTERTDPYCK